jgi:hypothetical protein
MYGTRLSLVWLAMAAGCASTKGTLQGASQGPRGNPPPSMGGIVGGIVDPERARYRITYGWLGDVGDLTIDVRPQAATGDVPPVLDARGFGTTSILGFGERSSSLTTKYDLARGLSVRWSWFRQRSGKSIDDTAEQSTPGQVHTLRRRQDEPDHAALLAAGEAVFDPLGLLMFLRTQGPRALDRVPVLEGRALWHVSVRPDPPTTVTSLGRSQSATVVHIEALPVRWDRQPDPATRRKPQRLTLTLANDPQRTPLFLRTSAGPAEVLVQLVSLDRGPVPPAVARR